MNKALTTCLLLAVTGALAAQKDVITWDDGTQTKCEIVRFDSKNIEYKVRGRRQTAVAHKVRSVQIHKLLTDVYNRAITPEDFLTVADEQFKAKKELAGAWGYMRAAELFEAADSFNSAATALAQLDEKVPNSPWTHRLFTVKFRYYISNKKRLKNAQTVAEKYESEAIKRNWARGYEHQAKFFMLIAEAAGGKMAKDTVETKLKQIMSDTDGTAGFVFKEAKVFLAEFYRQTKDYAKAVKEYDDILELSGVRADLLGRVYLGLGYIHYEKGVVDQDKEAFHQAYLSFLRVYILAKEAHPEVVAEGLFHAAQAVESWGGLPTSKFEAARLRGRLRLRSPWKETSWAKKKR